MFDDPSSPIGDNLMYPFVRLGQYLKERGHRINTLDRNDLNEFDAIMFIEFPTLKNKYFVKLINENFENLYLLLLESQIVRPDNFEAENHKYFKKIFTWRDDLIDEEKYFKINYAQSIPEKIEVDPKGKDKLCTMIVGNKHFSHPLELYSERIKVIRWFEKNHPEDFDLYGVGWDEYLFKGAFSKMNRFGTIKKVLKSNYPSYKGRIESKREVLQNYKFAICYENARDIPGYITEKIFDCFFAECVPIYWGAPNVREHIPQDTFIDRRDFKNHTDLFNYINNMPQDKYTRYLEAINNFVKSDKIYPFSAEFFAETVTCEVVPNNHEHI